jgi:hypothetical protein
MVGQASSHGRGSAYPAMSGMGEAELEDEAVVVRAEVVDTAQQEHTLVQGLRQASEGTSTPGQGAKHWRKVAFKRSMSAVLI